MWKKMRVLVVDDEQSVSYLIKQGLEQKEIFCDTCGSVPQARELLEKINYDIIISDLKLPGENGIELAKMFPVTRIIFITGYSDERIRLEKEGYRKIRVLDKPIRIEDLLKSLYLILENYSEEFCAQTFTNLCKELKRLKKNIESIKKANELNEGALGNLSSIYSGLSASYKFIYESIGKLETKITNRDKTFYEMNEITLRQVGDIKNKIDVLIKNGNSNGK